MCIFAISLLYFLFCFVEICNKVGSKRLPRKPPRDPDPVDDIQVSIARRATLRSSTKDIQTAQTQLKKTYDRCEEDRIIKTLRTFEASSAPEHLRAWKLVRELPGKRSGVIFIQGEDRLNAWKKHFSKLLNNDVPQSSSTGVSITPVFDTNFNSSCDPFTQGEVDIALKQMKAGKAPGLDGLPLDLRQLPQSRQFLNKFCNQTLSGNRPDEWGLSGIVPVP